MRDGRDDVVLAVTMGDPRGIGPEVIVKALARTDVRTRMLVVGSGAVLAAVADRLGLHPALHAFGDAPGAQLWPALLDVPGFPPDRIEPRRPDALGGRASIDYIEKAVALALAGRADAVVTAPINKEAIAAAGARCPGHTEMLAALTGAATPVMMLVNGPLRVALATTHVALRDVPGLVSVPGLLGVARVLNEGLRRFFGTPHPRIALCGLNPHCGDGGRFGDEEARLLAPAVAAAGREGIGLTGPEPADTVFVKAAAGAYDAVLALYHDQGMIPVKLAGLGAVVNVTLGLPIVRTSVGHGTAYDIAGTGRAEEDSLVAALRLGAQMARTARAAR
ncbi:MAG: 4-hydroxythreonine-4-phosphate dehydrogenase PdxA [Candidatus Brocadiaceae bacterium]|nr:4-hydroxythreonine-4-phosphate dehydrogenase PdxA [Candidatus Brocadiaceae bacterium]